MPKRTREESGTETEGGMARHGESENGEDVTSSAETVIWTFGVPAASAVYMRRAIGSQSSNLGARPTTIGPLGEWAALQRGNIVFTGTTNTYMAVEIDTYDGMIHILWIGTELCVDGRYRLSNTLFSTWLEEPQFAPMPSPCYIRMTGGRNSRLRLTHAQCDYIIRFDSQRTPIVLPARVYYPMLVVLLREFDEQFMPRRPMGQIVARSRNSSPPINSRFSRASPISTSESNSSRTTNEICYTSYSSSLELTERPYGRRSRDEGASGPSLVSPSAPPESPHTPEQAPAIDSPQAELPPWVDLEIDEFLGNGEADADFGWEVSTERQE